MTNRPLKIIFAGTSEFAAIHLQALLDAKHNVCAVLTQPDRPTGRGLKTSASVVKNIALENDILVLQPKELYKNDVKQQLKGLSAQVMVVVAYGMVIPESVLTLAEYGCINVHASLLPRWRGASPIQFSILSGDDQTGVTVMQMDSGIDTGAILMQKKCDISNVDTTASLSKKLEVIGSYALLKTLQKLGKNGLKLTKQPIEGVTVCKKITKEQAKIDWALPAQKINRYVRAFNPWPVAQTEIGGEVIRIWKATPLNAYANESPGTIVRLSKTGIDVATGEGTLRLQAMQFSGAKQLTAQEILNSKKSWFEQYKKFQ